MRRFVVVLSLVSSSAFADKIAQLEKCYQPNGQVETVKKGGKEVTTYKNAVDVGVECNEEVIAEAKKTKKLDDLMKLAGVIGRNHNWQSAMPVYALAVKADKAKAKDTCTGKDPMYAFDLAISTPPDHKHWKGAKEFLDACWPNVKDTLITKLDGASGYGKDNLCAYLTAKKALPADKKNSCAEK